MKKSIQIVVLSAALLGAFSANAQLGGLKKGVGAIKDKAKPISNESTTTSSGSNFSDLEKEKMEWTSTFERLEKKWDQLPFTEYEAKKAEYNEFYKKFSNAYKINNKKDHSDTYTQKLIATTDGYYSDKVSPESMAAIKNTVKRSFDDKDWTVYPTDRVNDIETGEKQINNARVYLKQPDADLEAYEQTLKDQKAKIIKYVEEGGLAKRDAAIEKQMVEKRQLHAAEMTDASVVATVNDKIDKAKYGTPLKVVITSKNWDIERTQYGQIKLKFVKVDIATKKADGKCYYIKGSVAQKYEGGGNYGDKYLNIYYTEGEMNCANVNK